MSDATPTPTNDDSDSSSSTPAPIEYRTRRGNCGCVLVVIAVIAGIGTCVYKNVEPMEFYSGDISEVTCEYLAQHWEGEELTRTGFGGETKLKILKFIDVQVREHREKELVCHGTARTDSKGKLDFKMTLEEDPDGSQWHSIEELD